MATQQFTLTSYDPVYAIAEEVRIPEDTIRETAVRWLEINICKEGEKDWRNQTTTLMAKMMVPARTMKSLARSQRRRATFFTEGTR